MLGLARSNKLYYSMGLPLKTDKHFSFSRVLKIARSFSRKWSLKKSSSPCLSFYCKGRKSSQPISSQKLKKKGNIENP